jgi:hypothetical protein
MLLKTLPHYPAVGGPKEVERVENRVITLKERGGGGRGIKHWRVLKMNKTLKVEKSEKTFLK